MKSATRLVVGMLALSLSMSAVPWCSSWGQESASHLAIVAAIEGDGIKVKKFSQNDLESPAKMGMKLFDKDTVITPASATCSLMFNTGDVVKVAASSRLTVNMRPQDAKSLTSISRKLAAAFFTENPDEDTLAAVGGVRAIDPLMPIVLYPKDSAIMVDKPAFEWSEIPEALNYEVTLTDSEGNVFTQEVKGTKTDYPSAFPALTPGESYFWQVDVVLKDTKRSSETSTFVVATDDVKKEVEDVKAQFAGKAASQETHFFLAGEYQRHNLMHEAIAEYQKLVELNPKVAYPHEQLGNIYLKLGWKEKACESLAKAAELDPDSLDTHTKLAKLYDAVGQSEKAKQEQAIVDKMAVAAQGMGK